ARLASVGGTDRETLRGRPELGGNRTLAADDSTAPPARKNAACGQETAPAVCGDRFCVRQPAADAGDRGRAGGGFAAAASVSSSVAVGRRTFDMAGRPGGGAPPLVGGGGPQG